MSLFKSVKVINSGKAIILSRKDGSSLRYHSTWLRDNANDPKTRDKNNGQRLISILDIPVNTHIKSASLDKKGKNVTLKFLPKKKQVKFFSSWLEKLGFPFSDISTYLVISVELGGAALILVGLLVRWVCIPLLLTMGVVIFVVQWENGWDKESNGIEMAVTYSAMLLILLFSGGGK